MTEQESYNQLSYYTLSHPDPSFIHQHLVDAYTAQTATKETKPIALTFALVGLYLAVEKGFTGKQVQQMHMRMARQKKQWPLFVLPKDRGEISVSDIVSVSDSDKEQMIRQWCLSVWDSYRESHEAVTYLITAYLH